MIIYEYLFVIIRTYIIMQIVFTISEEKAMSVPAVNSALDVANWFFKQAEREEMCIRDSCIINIVAPMQIKLSATLKAGQWLSPM